MAVYNTIDSGTIKGLGMTAESLKLPPRPSKAEPSKVVLTDNRGNIVT
jgi:hypothetical protein